MFIKLNSNLIVNSDEIASVEQKEITKVNTLFNSENKGSPFITATVCLLVFKQGHRIEVPDVTVEDLWQIINKIKERN